MKWAVSMAILDMVTLIFLRAFCGYVWVNILTLSPPRDEGEGGRERERERALKKVLKSVVLSCLSHILLIQVFL